MFWGDFPHTIDEKGRVAIPVKWRALLSSQHDDSIVLTRFMLDGLRCLDAYPYSEWLLFTEDKKKKQERRLGQAFAKFESYYVSRAHDCTMDKQGRILIPPRLREYANLRKDVVFAGGLFNFRIWDAEAWERVDQAAEHAMMNDPDFLEGPGL